MNVALVELVRKSLHASDFFLSELSFFTGLTSFLDGWLFETSKKVSRRMVNHFAIVVIIIEIYVFKKLVSVHYQLYNKKNSMCFRNLNFFK